MRVFHLVLAPRLSGAEVLAKDLAIDQCADGMAVCVASLMPVHADFVPLQNELEGHGVQCWFPARRHRAARKLWNLLVAVRRFRPDVIFAHATIPSFYARALPLRVPVVYVMHSATNDFERPLFRRIEHVLSGRARVVSRGGRAGAACGRFDASGAVLGPRMVPLSCRLLYIQ
jgi:hypothetical protein